jgi:hypothetical protein
MAASIKGVSKGDRFGYKKKIYEVVAVCNVVDIENGEVIDKKCYAQGIDTSARNVFEIPFSTVKLNKVK